MPDLEQKKERVFDCEIDRQTRLFISIIKFRRGYVIERKEVTEGKYPEDRQEVTYVMTCRSDEQLHDTMSNDPHFSILKEKFARSFEDLNR